MIRDSDFLRESYEDRSIEEAISPNNRAGQIRALFAKGHLKKTKKGTLRYIKRPGAYKGIYAKRKARKLAAMKKQQEDMRKFLDQHGVFFLDEEGDILFF